MLRVTTVSSWGERRVQQYLRNELTRIAARRSPAELTSGREPMSRVEFEAIRQRLRDIDAA